MGRQPLPCRRGSRLRGPEGCSYYPPCSALRCYYCRRLFGAWTREAADNFPEKRWGLRVVAGRRPVVGPFNICMHSRRVQPGRYRVSRPAVGVTVFGIESKQTGKCVLTAGIGGFAWTSAGRVKKTLHDSRRVVRKEEGGKNGLQFMDWGTGNWDEGMGGDCRRDPCECKPRGRCVKRALSLGKNQVSHGEQPTPPSRKCNFNPT